MDAHLRRSGAALLTAPLIALGLAVPPAGSVNADHGSQVVSANPANFTPHVMNGSVDAVTQLGTKIIVGGTFTSVSPSGTFGNTGDDVTRNRIFAFDANTGAIDPAFNPNLGGAVRSLDSDGTSVYVGGTFSSVGGNTAIRRVVKLTAAGAVVGAFNAVPNAAVNDLEVRGSRLYVAGSFSSVASRGVNTARSRLAALDSTTGAVLSSVNVPFAGLYDGSGTTTIKKFDVSPDGSRLAAVGNFATAGGQTRVQLAVLDVGGANATVATWATNRYDAAHNNCAAVFDTFMRDVDFSPDGTYFVVNSTGAFGGGANSGTLCDTAARWETNSTGNDPTWADYTGGDTLYGVAVTGSAVYIGGHQRWFNNPFQGDQAGPGAVAREGIAALDPVNGLPLSWNPGRTRGVGAQAMFATSQGLWVGSDTTAIGGEQHGRIALMPLTGGTTIPTVPAAAVPNDFFVAQQTAVGVLQRRAVDGTGAPTGSPSTANTAMDWSTVRGAFILNGNVYYGLSNGSFNKRTFNKVTGVTGAQVAVNLRPDPDNGTPIPFSISTATGMFYDTATHRIYYTVAGDSRLFYRYFTPESEIVGAQTFQANTGGINFSTVAGLTLASGRIFYGSSSDGALRSAPFSGGQVTGGATVVSSDGTWRYRAIMVPNT